LIDFGHYASQENIVAYIEWFTYKHLTALLDQID